jgi:teichuronic acid biosynthesis glycosyltransferase TuaH
MPVKVEPYIIIAQQEWELNLGSNARNLAMEFSKDRPVMYVNPAMDFKSIWRQFKTAHGKKRLQLAFGVGQNTVSAGDNIWVHTPSTLSYSINWIKNTRLHQFFANRNAIGFFRSLRKAINFLGWKKEDCIVLNDSQMFTGFYTKQYLRPLLSFYYIRDNLVEHPYFKLHGSRIEPLTIAGSDAIFANSAYLADYARNHHTISLDIGQGCELDMYDADKKYEIPADIKDIPHPRIGYIGFLTGERLDISLLEELALLKKDWHWVLIGPEEIMFEKSKLHGMPNVYFLGSKKTNLLPGYIQQLDVCLNPQLINPLTVGNYPRKIDEYLAMGKPTVATDTPAMKMFLPHVELAVGAAGYIRAIEKMLQPQEPGHKRDAIACAKSHTWAACIEKIYSVQNQLLYV